MSLGRSVRKTLKIILGLDHEIYMTVYQTKVGRAILAGKSAQAKVAWPGRMGGML